MSQSQGAVGEKGPTGPPYPPITAGLGLTPTSNLDVPISAVFLALFVCGAIANQTIIQMNRRRGHKFLLSNLLFGFCMARTFACTMRIVWAYRLRNVSVAIAAQIFVAAGVVLLIVTNLVFLHRIIRAVHPIGWHKKVSIVFKCLYLSIVALLCALISCIVDSFYTRNKGSLRADIDVEHVGQTWFAVAAFIPFPILLIGSLLPKPISPTGAPVDKFGIGHFRHKVQLLLFTSNILTLGAAFRAGIAYVPRPIANPAWYHSKA